MKFLSVGMINFAASEAEMLMVDLNGFLLNGDGGINDVDEEVGNGIDE